MNIILALAEDRAIGESLRASFPKTDLLLIEPTAEDALRRLISVQADVLILDDAPTLGLHALKKLVDGAPATPVIALLARGDAECIASYTMGGARICLRKPFRHEELIKAVEDCVRRHETGPREQRVTTMKGQAFTGSISQHQMALRWLTRTLNHLEDPARLTQSLVESVVDVFDVSRAALLLQTNGHVRSVASFGIPNNVIGPMQLTFSTGLMRWLEENACLFDRLLNSGARDATKEAQVLGARLAAPLISGGRTCGAILVGDKASGEDFSAEERDLLTLVTRSASAYLEKAKSFRDASRQQARLDAVLANITAGVVTVRPDKTVSMMNQSAEHILQLRAVDVLGRSVQKLGSAFADVVLRAMSENRPRVRQQIRDVAINATLGLSVTPLGDEGAVAIFSVIPENEREGAGDNVAYSPIWEYLASRIAQEIKNPMVAINTFAQLLPTRHEAQDFREEFSEVVQREIGRINDVVDALFAFSRHPRLEFEQSSLNETVRRVLESFDNDLKARSIRLEMDLDEFDAEVNVDPILFPQAVHIVVKNSIEAMQKGGTLRIETRRQNGHCEVMVSDTGPGISPQDAPFVFLPFFSTKERGMGLGLTMAQRIMKQHDGALKLVTAEGKGGAFVFELPVVLSSNYALKSEGRKTAN